MIVHIASDLHLDSNRWISTILETQGISKNLLNTDSKQDKTLILPGDICSPRHFEGLFAILSDYWKRIIVVPGNHEFYGYEIEEALDIMRNSIEPYSNVFLLERETVQFEGITFLGTIGWAPSHQIPGVENWINDFTWIKDFKRDKNRCQELHEESMDWIRRTMKGIQGPSVLITHFGPVTVPIPSRFQGSPVNRYFITSALDNLKPKPKMFIHGHSHTSYHIRRRSFIILCNPLGYGYENFQYNANFLYSI